MNLKLVVVVELSLYNGSFHSYQGDGIASGGGQTLKSMRVLRVFRPLRVVNKLEKLKVSEHYTFMH